MTIDEQLGYLNQITELKLPLPAKLELQFISIIVDFIETAKEPINRKYLERKIKEAASY